MPGVSEVHHGGCQCGAVRYEIRSDLQASHVCHCRMCQRATGGLFAALVGARKEDVIWTTGAPTVFASSNLAVRGFCKACGTPLTFAYTLPQARQYVTIGSLDDPSAAPIEKQFGIESCISWVKFCEDADGDITGAHAPDFYIGMINNQAP
jgi:hypothetical protein